MIYLVAKGSIEGKPLFVKAENETEIEERIRFKEGERVISCITTADLEALVANPFAVVTG